MSVEFLHIFIHFFIGHEMEHRAKEGIQAVRTLMLYEVILTLGLGGLIYLEGEVSSHLSVITGNKLYKESIEALVHKPLRWYGEEYFLRTADKFNHDYEEVFMQVHGILNLFKNVVILVATALIVGGSHPLILMASVFVALFYYFLLKLLRRAHFNILRHYYDYKYEFVKVFNESIEGAPLIRVFGATEDVILKARLKYTRLASYKLAADHVSLGQLFLCDMASTFITAIALEFTLLMHTSSNISLIATSLMLLLNLEDVFRDMVEAAISHETFFRLNVVSGLRHSCPSWKWLPSNRSTTTRSTPNSPPASTSSSETHFSSTIGKTSLRCTLSVSISDRVSMSASTKMTNS